MVCFRYTIVNTLHKYDNKDNNNNKKKKKKKTGVKSDNKHWYDHVPKSFETSHESKVTKLRNQQVMTNRTIPNNKPDS